MTFAVATYIMSNILGLILTLFIELPVSKICGILNLKRGI